jgi:hypothetical protein
MELIAAVKSFIVQASGVNFQKSLIFFVVEAFQNRLERLSESSFLA